jgi:glycosyltransferase involved in cell wall biosynthesis
MNIPVSPAISIIIPAYNAEKTISETILSVIRQTYSNWELIVIDDGSKDCTSQVIRQYEKDVRIIYFLQPNGGVSAARNNGIARARGNFIAFLDADDVWLENNLQVKHQILSANPEIDFVFGNMYLTDESLNIIRVNPSGTDKNMLTELLKWEMVVIPCPSGNLLIRKKCFDEGIRFDEQLSTAADQDFSIYLSEKYRGRYVDLPLMKYRRTPFSMSKNISLMEKDHIAVYKKAYKRGLFKHFWFKRRCFSNLYLILAGSWGVDAKNKRRAICFLLRSFLEYPPNMFKFARKIIH